MVTAINAGVNPKTLYFDLDGTLLYDSQPKQALVGGAFERAVRDAGVERMVCVGSVVAIIQFLEQLGKNPDGHQMILDLCGDSIADQSWFRRVTSLVRSTDHRARCIDLAGDWWYLDDMALHFMEKEGLGPVYHRQCGGRIFAPAAEGDGMDVLDWLGNRVK